MYQNEEKLKKDINRKLHHTDIKNLTSLDLMKSNEENNKESVFEYFDKQRNEIYIDQCFQNENEFIINKNIRSQPINRSDVGGVNDKCGKTLLPVKIKRKTVPNVLCNLMTRKQFDEYYDNYEEFKDDISVKEYIPKENEQITPFSKEFHLILGKIQYLDYVIKYLYSKEYFKYLFVFCRRLLNGVELHIYVNFEEDVVLEYDLLPEIRIEIDQFYEEYYYFMKFNDYILKELIKEI